MPSTPYRRPHRSAPHPPHPLSSQALASPTANRASPLGPSPFRLHLARNRDASPQRLERPDIGPRAPARLAVGRRGGGVGVLAVMLFLPLTAVAQAPLESDANVTARGPVAPGDLDTSFGGGGKVTTDFGDWAWPHDMLHIWEARSPHLSYGV